MVQAFLKLFVITFVTLILCILVVIVVRVMTSGAQFEAPENAWFKQPFWWIYEPTREQVCRTPDIETLTPTKDWIIELPVRHGKDDWEISCTPNPIKLSDYLKNSKHHDWLLDVQAHDTWGLDQLAEEVNALVSHAHFGLTTHSQKVSVFLRKKAPEWLFAADSASLLRLRLFESLYLETAMEFWPDFVITSFTPNEAFHLDERGAADLPRRKKRIIWEWDGQTTTPPPVPFDGIMTNRPSEALSKFSPGH